jgi:hypothetical protein
LQEFSKKKAENSVLNMGVLYNLRNLDQKYSDEYRNSIVFEYNIDE